MQRYTLPLAHERTIVNAHLLPLAVANHGLSVLSDCIAIVADPIAVLAHAIDIALVVVECPVERLAHRQRADRTEDKHHCRANEGFFVLLLLDVFSLRDPG